MAKSSSLHWLFHGGEHPSQPWLAQRGDVVIPTAVPHGMQVVPLPLLTAVSGLDTAVVIIVILYPFIK